LLFKRKQVNTFADVAIPNCVGIFFLVFTFGRQVCGGHVETKCDGCRKCDDSLPHDNHPRFKGISPVLTLSLNSGQRPRLFRIYPLIWNSRRRQTALETPLMVFLGRRSADCCSTSTPTIGRRSAAAVFATVA